VSRRRRRRVPGGARKAYEQALKSRQGNDDQKALEQLDRAIELYPEYFQALTERGNIRMARNQLAEAAGDFERALAPQVRAIRAGAARAWLLSDPAAAVRGGDWQP
jgi:tetratricopeptide (TPR) repeat protein